MIYTVTLNPSIDFIVKVDGLKLGDLNRMKEDFKLPVIREKVSTYQGS